MVWGVQDPQQWWGPSTAHGREIMSEVQCVTQAMTRLQSKTQHPSKLDVWLRFEPSIEDLVLEQPVEQWCQLSTEYALQSQRALETIHEFARKQTRLQSDQY